MITAEHKYDLIAAHVTLNGKPAKISGERQPCAVVSTVDPSGPAVEFSWPAAARIVAAGGKFTSR